jgi:hypothetical protein
MPKFIKNPIMIEAVQWTGDNYDEIVQLAGGSDRLIWDKTDQILIIITLEGNHTANVTDWIIKGIKNEIYPCKNDIFMATYTKMLDKTRDVGFSRYSLEYAYDTEIMSAKIEQGEKISFFTNKFFPDGSEKMIGTDYLCLGSLGVVPMNYNFIVRGFGFDFESSSQVKDRDINTICNSSYIVFIADGKLLAFQSPLRWFSRIVERPILDLCNIELTEGTNYDIKLRFNNKVELSEKLKFQLIMKYDRQAPIR